MDPAIVHIGLGSASYGTGGAFVRTELVTFFCAAFVCTALVPAIRRFAHRRGLFDQITSSRKVHSVRIPRLGGIAIVAGFYAPLLALILYPTGLGSVFYADGTRSSTSGASNTNEDASPASKAASTSGHDSGVDTVGRSRARSE